jgi:hypothetical protein
VARKKSTNDYIATTEIIKITKTSTAQTLPPLFNYFDHFKEEYYFTARVKNKNDLMVLG